MNKMKRAILALLLIGGVFSFVGCQKEPAEEDAKKADAQQHGGTGGPSLGNPTPTTGGGK